MSLNFFPCHMEPQGALGGLCLVQPLSPGKIFNVQRMVASSPQIYLLFNCTVNIPCICTTWHVLHFFGMKSLYGLRKASLSPAANSGSCIHGHLGTFRWATLLRAQKIISMLNGNIYTSRSWITQEICPFGYLRVCRDKLITSGAAQNFAAFLMHFPSPLQSFSLWPIFFPFSSLIPSQSISTPCPLWTSCVRRSTRMANRVFFCLIYAGSWTTFIRNWVPLG